MGENDTFIGGEDWLVNKGIEVVNLSELHPESQSARHMLTTELLTDTPDSDKCKALMAEFIKRYPDVWNEDIGEE